MKHNNGERDSSGSDASRNDQPGSPSTKPVNFGDQRVSTAGEQSGDGKPLEPGTHCSPETAAAGRADPKQAQHAGSPARYGRDLQNDRPPALRAEDEEFDAEYLQWRNEQMRKLDDDYRSWRSQGRHDDAGAFQDWRDSRTQTDRGVTMDNPGHLEAGKGRANDEPRNAAAPTSRKP